MPRKKFATRHNPWSLLERLDAERPTGSVERSLRGFGRVRNFDAGSVLLREDKRTFFIGIVIDGIAAIHRLRRDGNNPILQFFGPNDVLCSTFARMSDVEIETLTSATIRCLDQSDLRAALQGNPERLNALLTAAGSQFQSCFNRLSFMPARAIDRLGYFFLRAIHRPLDLDETVVSIKRNPIVIVPVNRAALAAYVGTTTAGLSRMINALQEEGAIRMLTPRRFEILDQARLLAS